jgi:hypothetical protein
VGKEFIVTCRYCDEVVVTAKNVLGPEVARLVRHLEERHAERKAEGGGLGALLRAFLVERDG